MLTQHAVVVAKVKGRRFTVEGLATPPESVRSTATMAQSQSALQLANETFAVTTEKQGGCKRHFHDARTAADTNAAALQQAAANIRD